MGYLVFPRDLFSGTTSGAENGFWGYGLEHNLRYHFRCGDWLYLTLYLRLLDCLSAVGEFQLLCLCWWLYIGIVNKNRRLPNGNLSIGFDNIWLKVKLRFDSSPCDAHRACMDGLLSVDRWKQVCLAVRNLLFDIGPVGPDSEDSELVLLYSTYLSEYLLGIQRITGYQP